MYVPVRLMTNGLMLFVLPRFRTALICQKFDQKGALCNSLHELACRSDLAMLWSLWNDVECLQVLPDITTTFPGLIFLALAFYSECATSKSQLIGTELLNHFEAYLDFS